MPSFGKASRKQLDTAHPDLQKLFNKVVQHWDCTVIEGKRSEAQHKKNLASGASKTLHSKHVTGDKPSMAVDVAPYPIKWKDEERFYAFAGFVIGVAWMMGIRIRWGGDWDSDRDFGDQTFNDLVHFELVK